MWIKNNETGALFDIEDESLIQHLLKQPDEKFTKSRVPKDTSETNSTNES